MVGRACPACTLLCEDASRTSCELCGSALASSTSSTSSRGRGPRTASSSAAYGGRQYRGARPAAPPSAPPSAQASSSSGGASSGDAARRAAAAAARAAAADAAEAAQEEKLRREALDAYRKRFVERPPSESSNGGQKGAQKGAQKGSQKGAQKGAQTGAQKGAQKGAQTGAQKGAQKGAQTGAQKGAQKGTQTGAQKGTSKDATRDLDGMSIEPSISDAAASTSAGSAGLRIALRPWTASEQCSLEAAMRKFGPWLHKEVRCRLDGKNSTEPQKSSKKHVFLTNPQNIERHTGAGGGGLTPTHSKRVFWGLTQNTEKHVFTI